MTYLRLAVLSLFFCAATVYSAPSRTLSLSDAIYLALRYNPNVKNAEVQRIIDKFNLRVANYAFEVQFALTGSVNHTQSVSNGLRSESDTQNLVPSAKLLTPLGTKLSVDMANKFSHTVPNSRFYNPAVTFSLTQPLLRGFGPDVTLAPLYNARDQEISAQLTFKNQVIQTITQVINQYLSWMQAQSTLKTQEQALTASNKTLAQYRDLIKAGRSPAAGIVQFEVDVANAELSVQQQRISLQQTQFALLNTLGMDPTFSINPPEKVEMIDNRLPSLEKSIALGLKCNPAYQQALINIRVLKRQVTTAHDNTRTKLDFSANQVQGGGNGGQPNSGFDSLFNGKNRSTTIGLSLDVPINNLPLEQAEVAARIGLKQAQTRLEAQKRQLISDITNGYHTLLIQKAQIKQAFKAMQLANQNLEIANLKLRLGKITPFEVSSQRLSLTNAQLAYINSKMNYITTLANFEQTLGTTLDRWKIQVIY